MRRLAALPLAALLAALLALPAAAATQDLPLTAGFNFLGLTVTPDTPLTTAALFAEEAVQQVFLFDASAQSFAYQVRVGGNLIGTARPILPGAGFIVKAESAATLRVSGSAYANAAFPLAANFNLVGMPGLGAAVAAKPLFDANADLGALFSWNGASQAFDFLVRTGPAAVFGPAIDLAAGRGYFIRATNAFTLSVDGSASPVTPAARDLSVAGYTGSCLVAVNVSGDSSDTAAAEAAGTLPANAGAPPARAAAFGGRSRIKDRYPHRAPAAPSRSPSRAVKLTESATEHAFTLTDDARGDTMPATKVYGTADGKCLVFCETAQLAAASAVNWSAIGTLFDGANGIYDKMVNAFGAPSDLDDNGKVIILYYAMTEDNTLGYFHSADLYAESGNGGMEIFYMNLTWGGEGVTDPTAGDMVRTLAHEFQHMINHARRRILSTPALPAMDAWMDEGLAESAEQLVSGTVGQSRIDTFKNDAASLIRNGQPLCVWKNNDESYALSYTFFQYLKNQASSRDAIFRKFIEHAQGDYRAIEAIMRTENPAFSAVTFADLLALYRVANVANGDGMHGYGSEKASFDFRTAGGRSSPASLAGVTLQPGGAVHVYPSAADLTAFAASGGGAHVQFVKIHP